MREPGSEDRIWWGDVNADSRGALRRAAREGRRAPRRQRPLRRRRVCRRRSRAPDRGPRGHEPSVPRALRPHDVHRPERGRAARFEPQALVLHAPELEADPAADGTRTGTFVVLHPSREEVLIGGTFYAGEIKKSIFTLMNDRLPLEGVFPMHCSANVGDARRRRDLLRPLRHREDDALGRSGAHADRRRRARLGRRRRLQLRGRLLREGDPPLGGGRAGDLQDDPRVRDDPRERRHRRARRRRPRRRLEDREHARRLQARADRERAAGEARRASGVGRSSSPPTRSGCCRRSRGSHATRRCTGSSPASRRSSPAPRSASRSRSRPSRPASARRSCRSRPWSTPACSAKKLDAHGTHVWLVNTGWTGGPFGEGSRMPIKATRALLRAALAGELDGVEYRTDACSASRCRSTSPASTRSCSIPAPPGAIPGVRREGPRARGDVPRQLRAVRRRREPRRRRPARLSCPSRGKRLAEHIVRAIDFLPYICIECNFAGRLRTSKKQSSKTIKTPKKGARMLGLKKPSPALVIALLALFISLSGTAVAAGIVPLASGRSLRIRRRSRPRRRSRTARGRDNAKKVGGQTAAGIVTQAAGTPGPARSAAGLVTVKQAADTIAPGTGREVVIACDAGKKVVSGGWCLDGDAFGFDSRPISDRRGARGWGRPSLVGCGAGDSLRGVPWVERWSRDARRRTGRHRARRRDRSRPDLRRRAGAEAASRRQAPRAVCDRRGDAGLARRHAPGEDGESVTVFVSDTYAPEQVSQQVWADFFAGLPHGKELSSVIVRIAPIAEVATLCGSGDADGCYNSSEIVMNGDFAGRSPPEDTARHESAITSPRTGSRRRGSPSRVEQSGGQPPSRSAPCEGRYRLSGRRRRPLQAESG